MRELTSRPSRRTLPQAGKRQPVTNPSPLQNNSGTRRVLNHGFELREKHGILNRDMGLEFIDERC